MAGKVMFTSSQGIFSLAIVYRAKVDIAQKTKNRPIESLRRK